MFSETGSLKLFFSVLLFLTLLSCRPEKNRVHVLKGKHVIMVEHNREVATPPVPSADTSYLEFVFAGYNLVDINTLDSSIKVQLRYADTSNFLHRSLYDGLRKAYMTCELAIRLCNAQHHLKTHDSTLSLLVLDAARPLHIQQLMWDSLNLVPALKKKYLTPPESASLHNYGCALDLTIVDENNQPLDMGSGFDEFDSISQPRFERYFLARGQIEPSARDNRMLLRHVLETAGLSGIGTEWWHFSLCSRKEAMTRYELIR